MAGTAEGCSVKTGLSEEALLVGMAESDVERGVKEKEREVGVGVVVARLSVEEGSEGQKKKKDKEKGTESDWVVMGSAA